jgi:serine/threonine-protein kinase ATR
MAVTYRKISAQALYTAIPQLISRITHDDVSFQYTAACNDERCSHIFFPTLQGDTSSIVQAMLRRVLIKYPAQAMWPLAWIRQSRDPQRLQIGVDIFNQATEALNKSETLHKLLVSSKALLDYLYALAKKDVGEKVKDAMKVRPLSDEVDLSEFVPPIQAALSSSLVSGDSSRARDVFPRHIPRMRAIDEIVGVMSSKARPKKIKVYMISADSIAQLRKGNVYSKDHDIGEIHFLLKQEAKGDLRKDARVQDLNNVVNRIMSSMDNPKGLTARCRRLHLRTFCVTCLSEDTGLLEWVPHTASLRSMISKTYNPQADVLHGKRQGRRITNFNDPQMRIKFETVCQAAYFISGNLIKATALFETECLSSYPPILYWWYVLQFPDPHAWYEARTRFALSSAAWSAVGHVIGLGDRHSDNILLDKSSGECVHVDFDW